MNNDVLQPWARWLVNYKMKWLLTLWVYLLLPVYIAVGYSKQIMPSKSVEIWSGDIESLKGMK